MGASSNPLIRGRNPFERRIIDQIERSKPNHGVGVFAKPLPGGVSQSVAPQRRRSVTVHPFFIYRTGLMHAGTVNGLIPTLGDEPIGETGNNLTLSGDGYVYLCASWSLTFGSTSFLSTAILNTVTVIGSTSPITVATDISGVTLTTYRLVAQIIGGVVQRDQQTTTNLLVAVCDSSDGSDTGKSASATWSAS
jgi:hypothetical protein